MHLSPLIDSASARQPRSTFASLAGLDEELINSTGCNLLRQEAQLADQLVDLKMLVAFSESGREEYKKAFTDTKDKVLALVSKLSGRNILGIETTIASDFMPNFERAFDQDVLRKACEESTFGHVNYNPKTLPSELLNYLLATLQAEGLAIPEEVQEMFNPYIKIAAKCIAQIKTLMDSLAYVATVQTFLDRVIVSNAVANSAVINADSLPSLVKQSFPERKDLEDFFHLQNKVSQNLSEATDEIVAELASGLKLQILSESNADEIGELFLPADIKFDNSLLEDVLTSTISLFKVFSERDLAMRSIKQRAMLDLVYEKLD